MFKKILGRVTNELSATHPKDEPLSIGAKICSSATNTELRDMSFTTAVRSLDALPVHNYSMTDPKTGKQVIVIDKIAEIIVKKPSLINNHHVQKLLTDIINLNNHWKDQTSNLRLLSNLQPVFSPENLNKVSSETLRFVGKLRRQYLFSVNETLKTLKLAFKDDMQVVHGYNGSLPPGLKHRLKSIRKLTRSFKNSEFGKYEPEIIAELEKTKSKWNRAVMPRLLDAKDFRREFKQATGRHYGQKPVESKKALKAL